MPFNVGDRVRFTDRCRPGWFFGPHTDYHTGVISAVRGGRGLYTYGVMVDVRNFEGSVNDEHIELIEAAAPPINDEREVVVYTVFFKQGHAPEISSRGFDQEGVMNAWLRGMQHITVVAKKKIKIRIPTV